MLYLGLLILASAAGINTGLYVHTHEAIPAGCAVFCGLLAIYQALLAAKRE